MGNIIIIPYYHNTNGGISNLTGWISVSILASSIFIASVFVAKGAWDDDNVLLCAGSVIFSIISFAATIYCIYQLLLTGGVL